MKQKQSARWNHYSFCKALGSANNMGVGVVGSPVVFLLPVSCACLVVLVDVLIPQIPMRQQGRETYC